MDLLSALKAGDGFGNSMACLKGENGYLAYNSSDGVLCWWRTNGNCDLFIPTKDDMERTDWEPYRPEKVKCTACRFLLEFVKECTTRSARPLLYKVLEYLLSKQCTCGKLNPND